METYGDLKKIIKSVSLKQKGEKVGKIAIDTVLGAIPGIGAAKTSFDFFKAAFKKPDDKKTSSWLDKLDVDDEMSAIVDDTVENGFLKAISAAIEKKPDDEFRYRIRISPMDDFTKVYLDLPDGSFNNSKESQQIISF